jgi:Zn ribbon nucleic-acid-binding protein
MLREDLDKLAFWEEKWMMKFHPDKCHYKEENADKEEL